MASTDRASAGTVQSRARPPAVAPDAVYDGEEGGWVTCAMDAEGRRQGPYQVQRDDGSLARAGHYADGVRTGTVMGYHPNGDIASEGTFRDGKLEGVFVRHASAKAGALPLRSCCVPAGAREMRSWYQEGRVQRERFFDAEGFALRSDGKRLPPLPEGFPDDAEYEESSERWVLTAETDAGESVRRYFDAAGALVEESALVRGRRTRSSTHRDGRVVEERAFDERGALHGAYYRAHLGRSPYQDTRIQSERGSFEHGHPVGRWTYHAADGRELYALERGAPLSEARLIAHAETACSSGAEEVRARAQQAFEAGQVREALWLAARVLSRRPDDTTFAELLQRVTLPLGEQQQHAWQRVLDASARLDTQGVFDALLSGAEPASALRVLATLAPEGSPAGLELIDASLVLAPEQGRARASRALLRLEQGDVEGTTADAAWLASAGETDVAEQLRTAARVVFSPPAFVPEREPVPEPTAELPELGVAQPLHAVRRTIQLYATRLLRLREALVPKLHGREPEWLPQHLSVLLPDGPIELLRHRVTIQDESEDGIEATEVVVDETEGLSARSAKNLMITARADWDALCWLCWSVGLDRVELPDAVRPPPRFAVCVNETMVRAFRLHDQLRTGGLASRVRGVVTFTWEGLPVDKLPRSLAECAAKQYRERRAALFWLLFEQNVSPFQEDLRKL